jgi:hypothetical protein
MKLSNFFWKTTNAFHCFIAFNDLKNLIDARLANLDINSPNGMTEVRLLEDDKKRLPSLTETSALVLAK